MCSDKLLSSGRKVGESEVGVFAPFLGLTGKYLDEKHSNRRGSEPVIAGWAMILDLSKETVFCYSIVR